MLLMPVQIKPKSSESGRNFFLLPKVDASHAWALGCFQSYQYRNLSKGADRVAGQLRGDKERPFSGVTKSGRVWRKVPESDARSRTKNFKSRGPHTLSIAFRHPPPNSAIFSYATEGVLFMSAQLSSDAVSALRSVPVLI